MPIINTPKLPIFVPGHRINIVPKAAASGADMVIIDLEDAVAEAQKQAANSMKEFDLGLETDLSKVMVDQQISSLGFQLTLNIRNKMLSAYKDILNMPV